MKSRAALIAIVLASGCAGDFSEQNPDGGLPSCSLTLIAPASATVGQATSAQADVATAGASGAYQLSWMLTSDEGVVGVTDVSGDGTNVTFTLPEAGVYTISVAGSVGDTSCAPASAEMSGRYPDAEMERYRLRVAPRGDALPIQEILVDVYGGGDSTLGTRSLTAGAAWQGSVVVDGAAVPAYLRATRVSGSRAVEIEGFASAEEGFELRVPDGSYRLLVVPDDAALAPLVVSGSESEIGGDIDVSGGVTVTGRVLGPDGDPVVGAAVGLIVDGVPSSLATTAGDGGFAAAVRPGFELSVEVSPPAASGLPTVRRLEEVGTVDGETTVEVAYDPSLNVEERSLTVTAVDGTTPASGAWTRWQRDWPAGVATMRIDAGEPLAMIGATRLAAAAATGGVVDVRLPDAVYEVTVAPSDPGHGSPAITSVDTGAGPAILSAAAPAVLRGLITDADGDPLAGARIRARAVGGRSGLPGMAASTTSDTDGSFALAVAGDTSYELDVLDDAPHRGRLFATTSSGSPGTETELETLALPEAVRVRGRLSAPGIGSVAHAAVTLLCADCGGVDATRPLAEATSDMAGRFTLRVPDPGVGMP